MSDEASFDGRRMTRFVRFVSGERQLFVVVNVVVNMVLLLRSYVTMQVLDYRGLGVAALLQTVILLIGTFQLGFLNGGFRLVCAAEGRELERINNLIYTYFGLLLCLSLTVGAVLLVQLDGADADLVALLGISGGVLTLVRTWMTNRMVAAGTFVLLNTINFFSAVASLAALLFISVNPLAACLAAVVAQPALFVLAAAVTDRGQLPTGIETGGPLVKSVLRAGFVLFLTGIFTQLNTLFERWYVTAELGVEALGHLYLAFLFVTLFQLVPTSLDQLYLPSIVRANNDGDRGGVSRGIRQFFLVVLAYCVMVALALQLAAAPIIELILPEYISDLRYVYLLASGLILFALAGPFAVAFNVVIQYRYYFVAFGTGTVATAAAFLAATLSDGSLNLDAVAGLRSAIYGLMSVILFHGYLAISREFPQFRFGFNRRGGAPS